MSMGGKKSDRSWKPDEKCVLCVQGDVDRVIYGRKLIINGIYFHEFCVAFSGHLLQEARMQERNECLSILKILLAIKQAEQTLCFVCGKRGAFITCAEPGCDRSFHLSCASEGECVTQYFGQYRSFCWEHRPRQAVETRPVQDTTCIMCMDSVEDSRGPEWDNNSHAQKGDKPMRCSAPECLYPHGREQSGQGPWQLLLCSSCAAQGTHRLCSDLSKSRDTWECNACAGEGTSSSITVDSAGPSSAIQPGLGPSQSPATSESSSSCSTTSQAPSWPAHGSMVPESSVLPSQRRIEWRRVCSRLHRTDDASNEPQGCCGSSRAAALSAQNTASNSATQGTSRCSRHSPAAGCGRRCRQGPRAQTRSRSPLQRRATGSPSRPQRRRASRHVPAPSANGCNRTYTRRGASMSSRDSTGAVGSRRRQPSRARTRSRSPINHRAAEARSQPQRHRGGRPDL
ncbi:PHD finger protein 7-like [Excalfactoria chinensis]|uniref:PHD finger protein 7-like n=1 Tax=Excalfactoria chinensis TaxID=46218 RepID=UPI003B3A7651